MDSRQILLSDQFVISCGTVTIDPQRSKVLLIRLRTTDEYFLPKGRKDVGETLEETAKRETFEETGIQVELLPLKINTLATVPSATIATNTITEAVTEPIAMTQRKDAAGTLKIIFWFVAEGDSAIVPAQRQQQEGEDFDTVWKDFDDVAATLSFDDDRRVAAAAIDAFQTAKP
jgi:8-oxo-dGTP pyrophosphatase MutT (NUDIX family)